ncbi:MAG: hypothetical protein ABIA75_11445 [Candidatus Neomarinimicrobiota bacterium]
MKRSIILLAPALMTLLTGQETEVIKKTPIYLNPANEKSIVGELLPGATVTKLRKDKSGQYIMATVEFYIPMEALLEGRVAKNIGERQVADNATFKLASAQRDGNTVKLSLQVKNNSDRNLDFAPMMLLKVTGKGDVVGELNPFMGTNQGLAMIPPEGAITADLYYDFKSAPKNVELMCTARPGGDRVYYLLGF